MRQTLFVLLLSAGIVGNGASAKSLEEGANPVNLPPAGFTGGSFVDNDGCIYIKAGVNGTTTWVPRVTRAREVICGREPTFGAPRIAVDEPTQAVVPTARTVEAATSRTAPQAAPTRRVVSVRKPAAQVAGAQSIAPRVVQRNSAAAQPALAPQRNSTRGFVSDAIPRLSAALPPVPEGYKRAWTDGRLNPQRGLPRQSAARATVSSKAPAVSPSSNAPVSGPIVIHAATFADIDAARAAAQRLANAGLPTRIRNFTSNGQSRQTILLGPFDGTRTAESALRRTHRLGFTQAVPRQ